MHWRSFQGFLLEKVKMKAIALFKCLMVEPKLGITSDFRLKSFKVMRRNFEFRFKRMSLVWMAPLLPFTTEEAWEAMPEFQGKQESVHLNLFPTIEEEWLEPVIFQEWEELVAIRDLVLKELETARENKTIGNSLEASIRLKVPADKEPLLSKYESELPFLFIVSEVSLDTYEGTDIMLEVMNAPGEKCIRCWNYSTYVGQSSDYPAFCKRCEEVVNRMKS